MVDEIEELNKGITPWRKGYNPKMLKPYSEFYTQELADIVYQNRKKYFDFGISNAKQGKHINKGLNFWKEGFGARTITQDFYRINFENINNLDTIFI